MDSFLDDGLRLRLIGEGRKGGARLRYCTPGMTMTLVSWSGFGWVWVGMGGLALIILRRVIFFKKKTPWGHFAAQCRSPHSFSSVPCSGLL